MLTTGHPTPNQCEASAEKLQTSRVHARLVGLRAPTAGAAPQLGSSLVRPPETWRNRRCPVRIQGPESSAKGHSHVEKPLQPVQGLALTGSHPGPLALKMTLSAIAFRSPPDTSTTERHFRCGPVSSFFLELLVTALCSSCSCPVSYWTPSDLGVGWGGALIWYHIFLPLHTVQGVLMARILGGVAIFSSTGPVLSEPFTVSCLSWVAPCGMTHSFTELHKPLHHHRAVIHEGLRRYMCPNHDAEDS